MAGYTRNQQGRQGAMRGNQGVCRRVAGNSDSSPGGLGMGRGSGRCRNMPAGVQGQGGRGLGLGRGYTWQSQQGGLQVAHKEAAELAARKEALRQEFRDLENQISQLDNRK